MRQSVLFDESVDRDEDVLMARDIVEGVRAVFLDPWNQSVPFKELLKHAHHGRLSSASTGKSATMRFCFPTALSELNCIDLSLDGGASRSMSSSKSDILGVYECVGGGMK